MNGVVVMKNENRSEIKRAAKAVTVGAVSGACISMLLILVSVLAVIKMQRVPYTAVPFISAAAAGIGALFGGYICGRTGKRLGMATGAVCGVLVTGVLMLIGLISGGAVGGATLLRVLLAIVGGALGGVAGVNKRRRRK